MLPINLLNALKEYTAAQKPPLPVGADESQQPNNAPQFSIGQKLQGVVQSQVAANVFKVNVAGQLIQMNLPAALNTGQTVTLQVTAVSPKLAFAMTDSAIPLATPEELGSTAKLLSSLSQQAPQKAYVSAARSAPLWEVQGAPQAPQLAGMLRQALSSSGLFYESHQAQWLEGARSTAQLLGEPQNQPAGQSQPGGNASTPAPQGAALPGGPAALQTAAAPATGPDATSPAPPQGNAPAATPAVQTPNAEAASAQTAFPQALPAGTAQPQEAALLKTPANVAAQDNALPQAAPANAPPAGNPSGTSPAAQNQNAAQNPAQPSVNPNSAAMPQASKPAIAHYVSAQSLSTPAPVADSAGTVNAAASHTQNQALNIPDHLQTLVRQQLNALETGQIVWRGDVWPGQEMQWEVHEQAPRTPADAGQHQWVTQVYLNLPNLGEVSATLRLNSAGVGLTLNASNPKTRAAMSSSATELVAAMSEAGIPVSGLPVVDAKVPQS